VGAKEIGYILVIIGLIILLSNGLTIMYSLRVDEIEFVEVLVAILGAIVLDSGVFVLLKDDLFPL
jgi:membrane-bound ClpP family serine protease